MKSFQLATWYDTWNETGYNNLKSGNVPLQYASRYNLAFGELDVVSTGGYSVAMTAKYANDVKNEILNQAPNAKIYAGLGDTGIAETVADNQSYNNRSTINIVKWLTSNGYSGISIDAEGNGMPYVAELVNQLGASFRAAGLGIAVSAPWPGQGPVSLYGNNAVKAFNDNVSYIELQDYSSYGTPTDVPVWTSAGVQSSILMGGVSTENGSVQTSLEDTKTWTQYALDHNLGGMFSWRLDNDHGTDGQQEDVNPTFTGAKMIYDTVQAYN